MKRLILVFIFLFPCLLKAQETVQTGIASYYAKRFEGRRTSSGEKFSNKKLTAAHKTFPYGTKVKFTSLENGRSVIVTINDRLPAGSGRSIDLSRAAAKQLGFIKAGTAKVKIEAMESSGP